MGSAPEVGPPTAWQRSAMVSAAKPLRSFNPLGFNVTKRPGGVTCAGFAPDGMPLALQIIGHHLDDVRTVELTAWAEQVLGLDPVAPFPS